MKKTKKIFLEHEGERYVFKKGVASVPGCRYKGIPMKITLEEFHELTNG